VVVRPVVLSVRLQLEQHSEAPGQHQAQPVVLHPVHPLAARGSVALAEPLEHGVQVGLAEQAEAGAVVPLSKPGEQRAVRQVLDDVIYVRGLSCVDQGVQRERERPAPGGCRAGGSGQRWLRRPSGSPRSHGTSGDPT
jgi:hypothetical protein